MHSAELHNRRMRHPVFSNIVKITAGLAIIFGCAIAPTVAFAEDGNQAASGEQQKTGPGQLQVSPVTNRITLKAGESLEYSFTVKSPDGATEGSNFRAYTTPYYVTDESYNLSFSQENTHTQMVRWIEFKTPEGEWATTANYYVNAGEKYTVEYRINVPADIPAGGQYSAIFVEGLSGDASAGDASAGIKTVSRAGIVLYGNTNGETHEEAEVRDYSFDTFLTGGNLTAEARVENKGNTDFSASYTYTVKNLFGKTLYEDTGTKPILPDTTWHMHSEWGESPFMGIFQVSYKVTAPNSTQDETKVVLILPVIVMIIMILLLTTIIIWIILFIRKRRERKSRLLV